MLKLSLFLAFLLPATSHALPLTGLYQVELTDSCHEILQSGTTMKILDLPGSLDLALYMGDYAGGSGQDFQSIFHAEIGDVVSRPEKRFEDMGAQAVRLIAKHSGNQFIFHEYRYSPKLSDEEGLEQGFFQRIAIFPQGGHVVFSKMYGGNESYRCILKKLSN